MKKYIYTVIANYYHQPYSASYQHILYIDIHVVTPCLFQTSQLTMTLSVYWLCVAVLLSCNVLVHSEITTLYPTDPQDWSLFPYGAGDVEIQDGHDIRTEVDGLSHNIIFQGISYDLVLVSIQI